MRSILPRAFRWLLVKHRLRLELVLLCALVAVVGLRIYRMPKGGMNDYYIYAHLTPIATAVVTVPAQAVRPTGQVAAVESVVEREGRDDSLV